MIPLACLLLFAASTVVDLTDEVYQIPAEQWRYVELPLNDRPAMLHAWYAVQSGSQEVRMALMTRGELEQLRGQLPHGVIEATGAGPSGELRPRIHGPGDLVVVVDNLGESPSAVRLRIWLDYGVHRGSEVTRLSPQRQLGVIFISFAVFFGIVTWSARRLLRGIQK